MREGPDGFYHRQQPVRQGSAGDPSILGSPTNAVYFDPFGRVINIGFRLRM